MPATRARRAVERFLRIEALSGVVLLVAAAAALLWANSPAAAGYEQFWHTTLKIGLGDYTLSRPLHFWIDDGLMTVFFLVVGLEIRREMHDGALSTLPLAVLPLAAAAGGVLIPALLYLSFNPDAPLRDGWAVPTATDIAFAVGVLALLGRAIPSNVRVLLLALAIIDDIAAVLIIAFFYTSGFNLNGLLAGAVGVVVVLILQRWKVTSAWAYVLPGAVLWFGFLHTGAHPALAGVMLGLMTPVRMSAASRATDAPSQRVQRALHPWVAYGVMPLFALANAGVTLDGGSLAGADTRTVMMGVMLGLLVGKPLGILAFTWLVVRLGWGRLPPGVSWAGVLLIGLLGGIGFTMAIFIANLAFDSESLLKAAKAGIMLASALAGVVGLLFGFACARRARAGG